MSHFVRPTIDGDWTGMEFTCTEPEGSMCRITCPPEHSCEEFSMELVDGEPWHVGYRYDDETDEEIEGPLHKMVPVKSCTICQWDALNECYEGEPTTLREGEIVFTWNGDFYGWRYAEEKPSGGEGSNCG